MTGQTRGQSFVEAATSVAIGYIVSLLAQLAIYPLAGIHVGLVMNAEISALFTLVSLVRQYVVRRAFNALHATGRMGTIQRKHYHTKGKDSDGEGPGRLDDVRQARGR